MDAWTRDFQDQKCPPTNGEAKNIQGLDKTKSSSETVYVSGETELRAEAESLSNNTREAKRRKYFKMTSSKRHECIGMMHGGPTVEGEIINYSDDDDSANEGYDGFFAETGGAAQFSGSLNAVEQRCRAVEVMVQEMRWEIFEATELTASAGIACNRMLAKVASDMNKPNGQVTVCLFYFDICVHQPFKFWVPTFMRFCT